MSRLLKLVALFLGRFKVDKKMNMKNLAVFDFDHTIIDDNSDTAVLQLINRTKIPNELKKLYKADGWTAYMQGIFKVLYENNIQQPDINNLIKNIPEVQGMSNLIRELHDNMNYDVIIISDSNTHFIQIWLEMNNLQGKILKVFSNPAQFDDAGLLCIRMYHVQDVCALSTKNLCKGMIMENFVKEQHSNNIIYERIIYIGDGENDICPILRLNEKGIACVRNKYRCLVLVNKILNGESIDKKEKDQKQDYSLKSQVCIWENGYEILNYLNKN
ncbi:putative phosphatase phospho2 [Rhynchophorus ferrugineus]|uniref:putative phosphatase phospho2 n=1 Tax=Rhynchophorus ferrugineus TaxID=354439 RepID=UPI003FCE4A44